MRILSYIDTAVVDSFRSREYLFLTSLHAILEDVLRKGNNVPVIRNAYRYGYIKDNGIVVMRCDGDTEGFILMVRLMNELTRNEWLFLIFIYVSGKLKRDMWSISVAVVTIFIDANVLTNWFVLRLSQLLTLRTMTC